MMQNNYCINNLHANYNSMIIKISSAFCFEFIITVNTFVCQVRFVANIWAAFN